LAISTQIWFQRRLKLVQILKSTTQVRDSEASIPWKKAMKISEADIFIAFSEGEGKKRLAHDTSVQLLCI